LACPVEDHRVFALKLYEPDFEAVVMPFDKILDAVQNGWSRRGC